AQKASPERPGARWGWRYAPGPELAPGEAADAFASDADMSVTGWAVMALKSAQLAGLAVPQAAIDGALDFTRHCTAQDGLVGYRDAASAGGDVEGERYADYAYHLGTMSSIGMCVRIFLAHDRGDPFLAAAADRLLADLPSAAPIGGKSGIDYYAWYYGSLALNQFDGPDSPVRTNRHWETWNKAMQQAVLALQDHTRGACSEGGWMVPDRWAFGYGPVYTTAINVLNLEVYYRYANALSVKADRTVAEPAPLQAGMGPR
ncbi:MAG TPA: hypothetical protein VK824_10820, partial [Planctomycetota bacterium]|nr:hypothetical protein [Planctomycetota bacterium]